MPRVNADCAYGAFEWQNRNEPIDCESRSGRFGLASRAAFNKQNVMALGDLPSTEQSAFIGGIRDKVFVVLAFVVAVVVVGAVVCGPR